MLKFNHTKSTPAVVLAEYPELHFTEEAITRIKCYIDGCDKEIGWLGRVTQYEDGKYLCDKVFLLHQDVGAATTEIQPEDLVKFAQELPEDVDLGDIRLWGHSHVNMGVSASGQDDEQMDLFDENDMPWFFRFIGNKKGDISLDFYNFERGMLISDCTWDIYSELDEYAIQEEINNEIEEKVRDIKYKPVKYGKGKQTAPHEYFDDSLYNYYRGWGLLDEDTKSGNTINNTVIDEAPLQEYDVDDLSCELEWELVEAIEEKVKKEPQARFELRKIYDISKSQATSAGELLISSEMFEDVMEDFLALLAVYSSQYIDYDEIMAIIADDYGWSEED